MVMPLPSADRPVIDLCNSYDLYSYGLYSYGQERPTGHRIMFRSKTASVEPDKRISDVTELDRVRPEVVAVLPPHLPLPIDRARPGDRDVLG